MESFLKQRNAGMIIEMGQKDGGQISEADRRVLITHAHAYLATKCEQIEKHHTAMVAKLLVFLVPCLKDTSNGPHPGYVSL